MRLGGRLQLFQLNCTVVNQSLSESYLWPNACLLAISAVVNIAAAVVIRKQERTRINDLIVWDCLANIFTMAVYVFDQSPWQTVGLDVPCIIY